MKAEKTDLQVNDNNDWIIWGRLVIFTKPSNKHVDNLCTKHPLCIRYESLKLMTSHILVLCNSLVDKTPTFQRNIVPLFSIRQTDSQQLHPKCQYLSTRLQDTKIRIHNTLKAINLIWSVSQCSLLSIQISEMHLNQHVTYPNTMWPPCSCRIIWGYPMATAYNTCCCYSPDFTRGWPSWYVTESNRVVLGQIAAATATATRFICVTHTQTTG